MAATVLFLWVHNIMGASGAVLKKKKKNQKEKQQIFNPVFLWNVFKLNFQATFGREVKSKQLFSFKFY